MPPSGGTRATSKKRTHSDITLVPELRQTKPCRPAAALAQPRKNEPIPPPLSFPSRAKRSHAALRRHSRGLEKTNPFRHHSRSQARQTKPFGLADVVEPIEMKRFTAGAADASKDASGAVREAPL